jgi:hypothetical protein
VAGGSFKATFTNFKRIENIQTERRSMQTTAKALRPAQNEVQRAAHDQDLVEVPKRAKLDRDNDGAGLDLKKLEQADEAEK